MIWTDKINDAVFTQFSMEDCKFAELNLTDILGEDWIQTEMKKGPGKRHPFANLWMSTGTSTIVEITSLAKDIELVQKCLGFLPILKRLQNGKEYESAKYEIHLAASFLRSKKYSVLEFSPEVGTCRADFRLRMKDKWIYVECTKMSQSREGKEFDINFRIISDRIVKILKKKQIYYCDIRISQTRDYTRKMNDPLLDIIEQMIQQFNLSYKRTKAEGCLIEILPLKPRMVTADLATTFQFGLSGNDMDYNLEMNFDEDANPFSTYCMTPNILIEDPYKIIIQKPISQDENNRITNKLDIVSKQLPLDEMNIVCMGMTSYQYADKIYSLVLEKHFNAKFNTRIGGIILTREDILPDDKKIIQTVMEIAWIPNPHAGKKIPQEEIAFAPLGKYGCIDYNTIKRPDPPCYQAYRSGWRPMVLGPDLTKKQGL